MDDTTRLAVDIAAAKHRKLKIIAATKGITVREIIDELIDSYLRENNGRHKEPKS